MKKTSKILLGSVLMMGFIITFTSFKQLTGIKLNDKVVAEVDNSKIRCVEVSGNIFVNLSSRDKLPFNIDNAKEMDYDNMSIQRNKDTMKIFFTGNKNKKNFSTQYLIFDVISYNMRNIKYLKASNGAKISADCNLTDSAKIIAQDSSEIFAYSDLQSNTINISLSDKATAYLSSMKAEYWQADNEKTKSKNIQTIHLDMKNSSNLTFQLTKCNIKGIIRNKAYIKLTEQMPYNYNINELTIKDSSAIIYRSIYLRK